MCLEIMYVVICCYTNTIYKIERCIAIKPDILRMNKLAYCEQVYGEDSFARNNFGVGM